MSAWLGWRLLKLLALAAFSAGAVGAACAPTRRVRLVLVHRFAVPGFIGLWWAGWMMAHLTGRTLAAPWILATLVASATALHAAFLSSHGRPRQRPSAAAPLVLAGLCVSISLMVLRPSAAGAVSATIVAAAALGGAAGVPLRQGRPPPSEDDRAAVMQGFGWIAAAEGASLIGMLALKLLGLDLDGSTGMIGWMHGVLVIVFAQALLSTATLLSWPMRWGFLGVLSALVPGGSFLFLWLSRRFEDWKPLARADRG